MVKKLIELRDVTIIRQAGARFWLHCQGSRQIALEKGIECPGASTVITAEQVSHARS